MGTNSKREQIIKAVKAELEDVASIRTVQRKLPTYEDLKNFAITQMPVVAMVSGLPVPVPHPNYRVVGGRDLFVSEITIGLYCYFQERTDPDTELSNLLDDIWAELYSDPTKGGLVIETTLKPHMHQDFWDPFYAFKVDLILKYSHSTGGI